MPEAVKKSFVRVVRTNEVGRLRVTRIVGEVGARWQDGALSKVWFLN
jgi:hypothetical protein